ncbi:SpoIIE family protein phosphatase [Heliorestis acidaminivorans]|uniref:SpoIIE family protein phosphatase n=1 Tax=Heliorestis acidaminivorans TaxID=553427 RepID=UPI0014792904|nr:SpoIIE family protein phosphatase [Heliorestis acidaminivorans]
MWDEPNVYPFRRERVEGTHQNQLSMKNWWKQGREKRAGPLFSSTTVLKKPWFWMQSSAQKVSASVSQTIPQSKRNIKKLDLTGWLWWLTLFFLARGSLLGGLSAGAPAMIAVVAARRPDRLFYALAGLVAGWASLWIPKGFAYGTMDPLSLSPLWQISATLILALLAFSLVRYLKESLWPLTLLTALTIWVVQAVGLLWTGPTLYGSLLIFFEGLLASLLIVAMVTVVDNLQGTPAKPWKKEVIISITLMIVLIALGIPEEPLYGVSPLAIFSGLMILLGAATYGVAGGTIAGVVFGLLPSIANFGAPASMALLTISGLLAGLFRNWAKPGIIAGYFMGHFLLSIYLLHSEQIAQLLIEVALASAIFLLLPPRWLTMMHQRIKSNVEKKGEEVALSVAVQRLEEMGGIFRHLAQTFADMSQKPERTERNWTGLYEAIEERVCTKCSSYGLCWERDRELTHKHLQSLLDDLEQKGEITPRDLQAQCVRWEELSSTIRSLFETVEVDRYWRRRMEESKNLVSAQFKGLSQWMGALSRDMVMESAPEKALEKVREVIRQKGYHLKSIERESFPQQWFLEVTGPGCGSQWSCAETIAPLAAQTLGKPVIVSNAYCPGQKGNCAFTLTSVNPYGLEIAIAQVPRYGSAVAGDTVSTWESASSKKIVALSDGAGIGPKAARESGATLALLEQLSKAGVEAGETVSAVNALVGLTTEDDSFATVDMALFDLSSAELELIKLGAAPSYLKRGRKVQVLQSSSLPLGIINTVEVDALSLSLLPGDLLIMLSDGITDGKNRRKEQEKSGNEDWVHQFLLATEEREPQKLADTIMDEALRIDDGQAKDDCTVIVVAVRNRVES